MNVSESTRQLIWKYLEGTISKDDALKLEQLMLDDENVRRAYQFQSQFESSMHFYENTLVERASNEFVQIQPANASPALPRFGSYVWPAAIVTLAMLIIGLGLGNFFQTKRNSEKPTSLQFVSYSGCHNTYQSKPELSGKIVVAEGILTLRSEGECLISLEGPCEFEMTSHDEGTLTDGKIVVYCGEDTDKLTIQTSSGSYEDIGTEFGVSVNENQSSLHVFDGQVFAKEVSGSNAQIVEGASAIKSGREGIENTKSMVDFASFDRLRTSLSTSVMVENFDDSQFTVKNKSPVGLWKLNQFRMQPTAFGKVTEGSSLSENLDKCLSIEGAARESIDGKLFAFLEAEWNYSDSNKVDISKPHTIECLVRIDCDPSDVKDFAIYGSRESTWKDRSWSVSANVINGALMWSVFNSLRTEGSHKFQHLAIERGIPFHVLIEIDPTIGMFRTTVSDGQQRIWNELFDGSPVSLKQESLGKLFWRIRGEASRKLAFSIDSIQVRNRPVFEKQSEDN